MAAVAGATYVLRHAVAAVLVDAVSGECVGVRTVAGQTLRGGALAADVAALQEIARRRADDCGDNATCDMELAPSVARAVCIIDASLQVHPSGATLSLSQACNGSSRCHAMLQFKTLKAVMTIALTLIPACRQEGISQLFAVMPPRALPGSNDECAIRILQVSTASLCWQSELLRPGSPSATMHVQPSIRLVAATLGRASNMRQPIWTVLAIPGSAFTAWMDG